jgi:(4-O-methyl)-D-glucuronate---lignin esterase
MMFRKYYLTSITVLLAISCVFVITVGAQNSDVNYDESKVPKFELPDPLLLLDGSKVYNAQTWVNKRRPEVLQLFEEHVYGKTPDDIIPMGYRISENRNALGGKAILRQITMTPRNKKDLNIELLVFLPKNAVKPVPVFIGLNFRGNHAIHPDPSIKISPVRIADMKRQAKGKKIDIEATRGIAASRWAVDMIIECGYGVATIYCGDLDPDYNDGFHDGVHPLFYKDGQTQPAPDEWGTIGAWSWGLSRALDYFITDEDVDQNHVAVMGHSRLGKTSLWAGAQDERFAMVISNDSGCGGAALSRRCFGERVARINTSFPHWFCDNFQKYNDNENELPVDQHMLIALVAPRPVYVASAEDDRWADPRGEFLSARRAGRVYRLFELQGVGTRRMPEVNKPVGGHIGYHIRTGKHNVTDFDWTQYLNFADKHFK